jgi:hypothetical protein
MFADYVCYFHQSFLQLSTFRKEHKGTIIDLLKKTEPDAEERKQLNNHVINYSKETKTKELLVSLKKITYV